MHLARIELALVLWKSTILPLNYKCTIALPRIELGFLDIFRYLHIFQSPMYSPLYYRATRRVSTPKYIDFKMFKYLI